MITTDDFATTYLHNPQEAFYRVIKQERKKLLQAKTQAQRETIKLNIDLLEAQASEEIYIYFELKANTV